MRIFAHLCFSCLCLGAFGQEQVTQPESSPITKTQKAGSAPVTPSDSRSTIVDHYMAKVRTPAPVTPALAAKIEREVNTEQAARKEKRRLAVIAANNAIPDRPNDANAPLPDPEFPEGVVTTVRPTINQNRQRTSLRQAVLAQRSPETHEAPEIEHAIPKPVINPFATVREPEEPAEIVVIEFDEEPQQTEVISVALGSNPEPSAQATRRSETRTTTSPSRQNHSSTRAPIPQKKRPFQRIFQSKNTPIKNLFKSNRPKPVSATK